MFRNGILLNVLYAEWCNEQFEKTMHIDDIEAIKRVQKLIAREMPESEGNYGLDSM